MNDHMETSSVIKPDITTLSEKSQNLVKAIQENKTFKNKPPLDDHIDSK